MPSMVKWFYCTYCKEKFWWWLIPLRTGGKHKKDCIVLTKTVKPKFKRCKPPTHYKGKANIPTTKPKKQQKNKKSRDITKTKKKSD